jgi:hypothetical protein
MKQNSLFSPGEQGLFSSHQARVIAPIEKVKDISIPTAIGKRSRTRAAKTKQGMGASEQRLEQRMKFSQTANCECRQVMSRANPLLSFAIVAMSDSRASLAREPILC